MTRSTMVSFLVEHKHPFLTRELELRLSTFVYETNYSDVSDEAIAELFSAFPEHFSSFINVDSDEYVDEKGLTETGRLIIRKLLDDALNYKCELIAMDDDVFEQLHDDVECMALNKEKAKKTRSGTARDRWDFFNRQKAKADPSFWQRATAFTPEEAVALSLGKDPSVVNIESLKPFGGPNATPFRTDFLRRLNLIERAIRVNELSNPIPKEQFCTWAKKIALGLESSIFGSSDGSAPSMQPQYNELYNEVLNENAKLQAELSSLKAFENSPGKMTRTTAYKLILGMAIARFEHVTTGSSPASGYIEGALYDLIDKEKEMILNDKDNVYDLERITVSDDIIRKALNEAGEFLSASWSSPIKTPGKNRKRPLRTSS